MSSKISFSFNKPTPKAGTSTSNPLAGPSTSAKPKPKSKSSSSAPKPFSFGDDDDDDDGTGLPSQPVASSSRPTTTTAPVPKNTSLIKQNASLGRQAKKIQEEAMQLDQTVFEYDEVWDGMQSARQAAKEAKEEEAAERKPKYIESFLQSAATRKLDRLRAEEKMLQHERDAEGDQFADKEKFVTGAYKQQMEDVKKAEEEEKAREEKERLSKKGPGMTAFYQSMLADTEKQHAAAVAGTSKPSTTQGPSLAIRPPTGPQKPKTNAEQDYDFDAEEDPFIRRDRERAKKEREMLAAAESSGPVVERLPAGISTEEEKIEINDEGAVVDKRVLLKAGLNITKKPVAPGLAGSGSKKPEVVAPYKSRAVGADASYEARMARERRRLADQMRDEEERVKLEKRKREEEEEERARKRTMGGGAEEGEAKRKAARERFEARKRAKLEEEAKKAANGDGDGEA